MAAAALTAVALVPFVVAAVVLVLRAGGALPPSPDKAPVRAHRPRPPPPGGLPRSVPALGVDPPGPAALRRAVPAVPPHGRPVGRPALRCCRRERAVGRGGGRPRVPAGWARP